SGHTTGARLRPRQRVDLTQVSVKYSTQRAKRGADTSPSFLAEMPGPRGRGKHYRLSTIDCRRGGGGKGGEGGPNTPPLGRGASRSLPRDGSHRSRRRRPRRRRTGWRP